MTSERQSIQLPAEVGSVPAATAMVRATAAAAGFPEARLLALDLVIEELLVNIALHAYDPPGNGHVEVSCQLSPQGSVDVEISDDGVAFDPLAVPAPDFDASLDRRKAGGLGIALVKAFVGSLSYRRDGDRNIVAFRFPLVDPRRS